MRYDVVVVGGGAMGAATACAARERGASVAMIEQFQIGHDRGSSHGRSRVFRLAYRDPAYVQFAQRAFALWRVLEEESGVALLTRTGGVDHGVPVAIDEIAQTLAGCGVSHERLGPDAAGDRFPGMRFGEAVLYQPDAGRLNADHTVLALHRRADVLGVELAYGERVLDVRCGAQQAEVLTGPRVVTGRVAVIAAGAWAPKLLASQPFARELPTFTITQEQPGFFDARGSGDWPSFLHHHAESGRLGFGHYGLFEPGSGVKVGEHGTGPVVDPDGRPPVDSARQERLERYVADWLPGVAPSALRVDSCLYTSTPDEQFVLRRFGPVVVCSPCSGHGFKFVPAVGERTAALALAE